MPLRHVRTAAGAPHHCVALPHLGANHPGGYFSFGTRCTICNGHAYVSVLAARQMATAMGFRAPDSPAAVDDRVARLEVELGEVRVRAENAERELAAAEKALEAVQTLKAAGYTAARRPGRPRKESTTEEVAA